MTIAYLTYWHKPRLPQARCLIDSIRRFDQESQIIAVVEDDCFRESLEAVDEEAWLIMMSTVEEECRELGLDWGSVRGSRSERDVAWTFQACYPFWFLHGSGVDSIAYIDSDCFFFQDIRPYIDRLPETAHVALCAHHYPPGKENLSAGVFNNGAMWWRNSYKAREIAFDWGKEAIAKWEPHEQKLLDAWPDRYGDAVAELSPAVDCGPWQLPKIGSIAGIPMLEHGLTGGPLQSYHFHELRIDATGKNPVTIKGRQINLTNYPIHDVTHDSVYEPYLRELEKYL